MQDGKSNFSIVRFLAVSRSGCLVWLRRGPLERALRWVSLGLVGISPECWRTTTVSQAEGAHRSTQANEGWAPRP